MFEAAIAATNIAYTSIIKHESAQHDFIPASSCLGGDPHQ
jgi:hypothetical protein